MPSAAKALMQKTAALPAERLSEVEDSVDFLGQREGERALARDAARMSAPAFAAIWNNPEDDIYDAL